jgi:hypothetical protein
MDALLFPVVVRHLAERADPLALRIDPRPLRPDPRVLGAAPGAFVEEAPGVLDAREELLRDIRVPTSDVLAYPRCYGSLAHALADSATRAETMTADRCPPVERVVASVGLPRAGDSCWPGIQRIVEGARIPCEDQPAATRRAAGQWTVRVDAIRRGPSGQLRTLADYVLERSGDDGAWSVVRRVRLTWSE